MNLTLQNILSDSRLNEAGQQEIGCETHTPALCAGWSLETQGFCIRDKVRTHVSSP